LHSQGFILGKDTHLRGKNKLNEKTLAKKRTSSWTRQRNFVKFVVFRFFLPTVGCDVEFYGESQNFKIAIFLKSNLFRIFLLKKSMKMARINRFGLQIITGFARSS